MSSSEIPPFAASADTSDAEDAAPVEADPSAPADAETAPVEVQVADTPVESTADTPAELDPVAAHIADQLVALNTVGQLPLAEHAQLYQHLHAELQDALADIDGS